MKKLFTRVLALVLTAVVALPAMAQDVDVTARKMVRSLAPTVVDDSEIQFTVSEHLSALMESRALRPSGPGAFVTNSTSHDLSQFFGRVNAPAVLAPVQDRFYGTLVYATNISAYAIYEFSSQAPASYTALATNSALMGERGGAYLDGKFYCTSATISNGSVSNYKSYVFDATTWALERTVTPTDVGNIGMCYSYDPLTKGILGINYSNDGSNIVLAKLDPESFSFSTVCVLSLQESFFGLGITNDGTIYAMTADGDFCTIDRTTGAVTTIKSTGLSSKYMTSGTMDTASDTFYWAVNNDTNATLYAIDTNGNASVVYNFANDEEFGCMYFLPYVELADPKAPATPTIGNLTFEGTSLVGQIDFSIPSTLVDGTPGTGAIRFELLANGEVIAQNSKIDWGHSYRLNITVPKDDLYTFELICYNEVGASVAATKTLYVGVDSPAAPKNVKAAYADGKITLTWNAVTTGANDGIIGENVTYAVYDAATGACLAEALTDLTYAVEVEAPIVKIEYSYYVVATADGKPSEPGYSNVITLGPEPLPYSNTLISTTGSLTGWTIVDANGDKATWNISTTNYGTRIALSRTLKQDDWLISPCFYMEKGLYYTITFDTRAYSGATPARTFSVSIGDAPTAEGMTTQVLGATNVSSTSWATKTISFFADRTGYTYVGIHAESALYNNSQATSRYLCMRNFNVTAGIHAHAPKAATSLNLIVPFDGTPEGTLGFTAPTQTYLGEALDGDYAMTRIQVFANDEIIYTAENPEAGARMSVKYSAKNSGPVEFKVVAYNADGAGTPAILDAYLGVNVPATPQNAKVQDAGNGKVNVTWDAVTTDQDGNLLNPEFITYAVIDLSGSDPVMAAEGLTAPELKDYLAVPSGQAFVQFAIVAETEAGISDYAYTDMIPAGVPYPTPFEENFANGSISHIWGIDYTSASNPFYLLTDADVTGIASRNGDNGMLWFQVGSTEYNKPGYFFSGNIEITEEGSVVELYTFSQGSSDPNTVAVQLTDVATGTTTTVGTLKCNAGPVGEWYRQSVDISSYYGKTVQLTLVLTTGRVRSGLQYVYYNALPLDDIRVGKPIEKDLVAAGIEAPAQVCAEKTFNISYTIANNGILPVEADSYNVSVYCRGILLESEVATPAIAAGASYTGSVEVPAFSILETGTYMFNYIVEFEGDENSANNNSAIARVKVVGPDLPAIDLEGEIEESTVSLSWDAPTFDVTNATIVESFESANYPAFTTSSFGGWTLQNYNTSATYGFNGISFPNSGSAFGWILFDTSLTDAPSTESLEPYEGTCMMGAFAHNTGANDAWLISPDLQGTAQTISFMAKASTTEYGPETMECWYSTSGTNKSDFIQCTISGYDTANGVTESWVKYSVNVPAGTRYFAIRSTATDTFILWVDCITYESSSPYTNLELQGYEIYRNNELIGTVPMTKTSYTDTLTEEGTYRYKVACVYNEGHSDFSNVVTVKYEVDGLSTAKAESSVAVEGKTIVVSGAEEATIVAADGKVITAAKGEAMVKATVPAGVYVVKTNDRATKVIVK